MSDQPCVVISRPASKRNPVRPESIPLSDWGVWLMTPDDVLVVCAGTQGDVLAAAARLRDDLHHAIAGTEAS